MLSKFLQRLGILPTRYPRSILVCALVWAAAGAYLYLFHLEVVSDRSRLLNPDLESNRLMERYLQEFGDDKYLILVVTAGVSDPETAPAEPSRPQREEMKRIARVWAEHLAQRSDLFPQVSFRVDPAEFGSGALLYLPLEALERTVSRLQRSLPEWKRLAAAPPSGAEILALLKEKLSEADSDSFAIEEARKEELGATMADFVHWIGEKLGDQSANNHRFERLLDSTNPLLQLGGSDSEGFFFTDEGRILTALATVAGDSTQWNYNAKVMGYARQALQQTLASTPDSIRVEAGLAGLPALEYEEMKTARRDFSRGSVIALVGVSLLFMLGFRKILHPLLAVLSLLLSIGMTFAVAWLTVGHLNLITMVFAIILIALGIDFGIHYASHYEGFLAAGYSPRQAVGKTSARIGGALWLGGMTTAVAFLSASFAEFAGLSELAIIAGAGLILCLLCMYLVFPAMLCLVDGPDPACSTPSRLDFLPTLCFPARWGRMQAILPAAALLPALAGYISGQYDFDTSPTQLQASYGEPGRWQRLLQTRDVRSTFAIATFDDRESLERTRRRFEDAPWLVSRTETLFPDREPEKRALLAPLCNMVSGISIAPTGQPGPLELKRQVWRLRHLLRRYAHRARIAPEGLTQLQQEVDSVYSLLASLPPETLKKRVALLDQEVHGGLADMLARFQELACPGPLSLEQVPASLKRRFHGADGTLAMFVYPAENRWDQEYLKSFVEGARTIFPRIFGQIIDYYDNSVSAVDSFHQSAGYALLCVVVISFFGTRSAGLTLLSLLPLFIGLGLLLGIMKWLPQPIFWNFSNFFAMPILIGAGVDSGIHLVAAWREGSRQTFQCALKAVLLSSLTTMIGFGVLATSVHKGVASLGAILLIGIGLILLVSWIILPSLLSLLGKRVQS